jgi:CheY-like chemotaxis protein
MRILVLDDEEVRHDAFSLRLLGNEVVHVWNLEQIQQKLKAEDAFDLIYLDHDLGEEADGRDVVNFIVRELPQQQWPKEVIVHSWNFYAANQMVQTLKDAGIKASYQAFSAS